MAPSPPTRCAAQQTTDAQPAMPSSPAYPRRRRSVSAPTPVDHANTTKTTENERTVETAKEEGDASTDTARTPNTCQALTRCTTPTTVQRRSRSRSRRRAPSRTRTTRTATQVHAPLSTWSAPHAFRALSLQDLPNEVLLYILGFLDVNDLLSASRTSRHLRCLCRAPILHILRRRRIRSALAPLIAPQHRPTLADLMARSIFLTHTTVVSRKLGRSLATIRLARRLAARPPAQVLVERCVLPPECAPGIGHVAPALAARTRAIERQRVKDGLRQWVGAVWQREVGRRSESIRRREERAGVGKVWRLRRFWERVSRGDIPPATTTITTATAT